MGPGEKEMNDEKRRLTALFAEAGKRNGYEDVTAEFAAFRDFKVRWTRSYRWANFEVSDYLSDAPEEVLASLAETIFRKIAGSTEAGYSEEVCDWLTSEDFVRTKQPTFLRRFRGLSPGSAGTHLDLSDSYDRLAEAGLAERDDTIALRWMDGRSSELGKASVLMRVATVSSGIDRDDITDNAVDFALYAQIARIAMGFSPGGVPRGPEYEELLDRYPGRREAEKELARIGYRS